MNTRHALLLLLPFLACAQVEGGVEPCAQPPEDAGVETPDQALPPDLGTIPPDLAGPPDADFKRNIFYWVEFEQLWIQNEAGKNLIGQRISPCAPAILKDKGAPQWFCEQQGYGKGKGSAVVGICKDGDLTANRYDLIVCEN